MTFLVSLVLVPTATASDLPGTGRFDDEGLVVKVYQKLPGTDLWGIYPAATIEPTREYRFEFACHVGDDINRACLPGVPACEDGEDGTAVLWSWRSIAAPSLGWTNLSEFGCVYSSNPDDVLEQIANRIISDFRNLPVDAGRISIQPSPHTLIGANTNVYASATKQDHRIVLLGQDVAIHAVPVEFTWDYGDGVRRGPTSSPGGPLPVERWGDETLTSHIYRETGDYQVSLTTTFRGTYSVNGGPDIPIPETGSFTAPAATISVWRSVVNNYADNCLENPEGAGC
jgi:hypothetical protein